MTGREVIERFFSLTAGGDPAALADCWGARMRATGDPSIALDAWSRAGPASDLVISTVDEVSGRQRFSVTASLANAQLVDWRPRDRRFFVTAVEDGSPRIVEIATALTAP